MSFKTHSHSMVLIDLLLEILLGLLKLIRVRRLFLRPLHYKTDFSVWTVLRPVPHGLELSGAKGRNPGRRCSNVAFIDKDSSTGLFPIFVSQSSDLHPNPTLRQWMITEWKPDDWRERCYSSKHFSPNIILNRPSQRSLSQLCTYNEFWQNRVSFVRRNR